MNNQLYLILFWILASCGMPVSSLYQDKMITVISAEKTEWTGGRAGVRGIMYVIKLKKKTNAMITIKMVRAEGNTISFAQSNSGNTIVIRGNLPYKNKDETMVVDQVPKPSMRNSESQNVNPKDNWIEYTIHGSVVLNRLKISKFISVETSEEPVP